MCNSPVVLGAILRVVIVPVPVTNTEPPRACRVVIAPSYSIVPAVCVIVVEAE